MEVVPLDNVQIVTADGNLTTFLLVLVALAGLFILFVNVIEAGRKLRKPKETERTTLTEHQEACEKRFEADYKRFTDLEKRMAYQEETSQVLCAGMHALLEHELHNGNANEMQRASNDLFNHLNKGGRTR